MSLDQGHLGIFFYFHFSWVPCGALPFIPRALTNCDNMFNKLKCHTLTVISWVSFSCSCVMLCYLWYCSLIYFIISVRNNGGDHAFGCESVCVGVCPCLYLPTGNLAYYWAHQPNIFFTHCSRPSCGCSASLFLKNLFYWLLCFIPLLTADSSLHLGPFQTKSDVLVIPMGLCASVGVLAHFANAN